MSKQRIEELAELILLHKKNYYSGNKQIEDEEYDAMEAELKKLDPDHPVLSVVGSQFFTGEKVKHDKKMLSLDKKYEITELESWLGNEVAIATYKIDGSSASLICNNGTLEIAKTRGDGEFGENISQGVFHIKNIPQKFDTKSKFEVRGEIFCTQDNFNDLVIEMEKRGLDKPSSLRNVVAGILGRKEHKDLAKFLTFFAFEYLSEDESLDEEEVFKKLVALKFQTPPTKTIKSSKEMKEFIDQTKSFMEKGEYLVDGAVFTFNSKSVQEEKGYTGHHPKYKMAFKFQGEVAETTINEISWQISKHGVFTPVALIEPVALSGATISNVTLHNLKTVKSFDLKSGVKIKIVRSGEVIPKFLSVTEQSNNELVIPSTCPFCSTKLTEDDNQVRLLCSNKNCVGRNQEYILNFIKKIGVDDLSDKRLIPMMGMGFVKRIPDIYKLTKEQILQLPLTKEKMADKILANIEKTKKVGIIKFVDALSFEGGAKKNTELCIENGYDSIDKLMGVSVEDLLEIKGFAEIKAKKYVTALQENKQLIQELLDLGVEVSFPEKSKDTLKNLTFCVTGNTSIPRKEIEKLIKSLGGKTSSSISSNTSYLICNEESGSSKYKKAQELKIEVLTENDFKARFDVNY